MADEAVRRSGRATKGQHTKNSEEPEPAPKKRGKVGRPKSTKKASQDDDEEDTIIRCICGYVVEDKNDKRAMICCDKCSAWQHNICMGLSDDDSELPDSYFCEQCKPGDHKQTLAALNRGEKPWEAREAEHQREEEEKKSKKRKGGKKGKGGRPSEIKDANDVKPPVVTSPAQETPKPKPESGHKRKLPPELSLETPASADKVGSSKMRKMSTPREAKTPKDVKTPRDTKPQAWRQSTTTSQPDRRDSREVTIQTELVEKIEDLRSENRQRTATALAKLFVNSTEQAEKQGTFKLPPGQSKGAYGLKLGLAVEYALYLNFWGHAGDPSPDYGAKLRMMLHNVRANPQLRDRVLSGTLAPNEFSKMSHMDMASKELQEQTAEIIRQAEKQHVLVQDEGPRMRRTHKGDELIGGDSQFTTSDSLVSGMGRRRESMAEQGRIRHSPEHQSPQSPNAVELPHDIARSPTSTRSLTVDTSARPKAERKSSSNFNIDNVWSSVNSPGIERQRQSASGPSGEAHHAPGPGVKADPEIDHLLKDDEDDEPYSPKDYEMEEGTVWRGNVVMHTVAEFRGSARFAAGADLSSIYPWSLLMPPTLSIEGRIDVEKASEYLCGLRWSKTTDVSVAALAPAEHADDQAEFDRLFDYFTARARYGVIAHSPVPAVRDIYVVPLEAGDAPKPEFVELLEVCALEDRRPARALLVAYVIKKQQQQQQLDGSASAQATPRQPDFPAHGSPIAPPPHLQQQQQQQQQQATMQPPLSPMVGRGGYGSPAQQQQGFSTPQQQQQQSAWGSGIAANAPPTPTSAAPLKGMDAARQVLGELANLPVVARLLESAPDTQAEQFMTVRDVFERQPATKTDWQGLISALEAQVKLQ